MSHYYDPNPDLRSQPSEIVATINAIQYTFITDHGVFSKSAIDFGTKVLLECISLQDPKHILDVGCGYGVVGIVLKHHYPQARITMFDINERAVALTKQNINRYGFNDIDVHHSDHVPKHLKNVSVAVLNPPIRAGKQTVFKLYQEIHAALKPLGECFIVIQKKQGANSSKLFLESLFNEVHIVKRHKGYYVFKAVKS
jgi:16S rRNA (guanine1207-N2)-methyltransferase